MTKFLTILALMGLATIGVAYYALHAWYAKTRTTELWRALNTEPRRYVVSGYTAGLFTDTAVSNIVNLPAVMLANGGIKRSDVDKDGNLVDPMSGQAYRISPVTPSGEVLFFPASASGSQRFLSASALQQGPSRSSSDSFWLLLPSADTDSFLAFFLEGGHRWLKEADISWYYQRPMECLTVSQRTNETVYRSSHGNTQ